jgi:hypothetical protein
MVTACAATLLDDKAASAREIAAAPKVFTHMTRQWWGFEGQGDPFVRVQVKSRPLISLRPTCDHATWGKVVCLSRSIFGVGSIYVHHWMTFRKD